ncbi:hypothetical protein GCM10028796_05890 [Ramlibacter monticola]
MVVWLQDVQLRDLRALGRSVHGLSKGSRRRRLTTLSRSIQVEEFEVTMGGESWVAVRVPGEQQNN